MEIVRKISQARSLAKQWKNSGLSVGFVPTMGYLHQGHLSLVERSAAENDKTIVSIFVNPTQFGPTEDLETYPRDLRADLALCEDAKADLVFCPGADDMYRPGSCTFVEVSGSLTAGLCGASRPDLFRGVATVVTKLFSIALPTRAYFGQKDAQQLAVIKRMVEDLDMDIEIVSCPTVREDDGLAKSSRNSYLTPEQRVAARVVSRAVFEGERLIAAGERDPVKVTASMRKIVEAEPLARIDYIEVVSAQTMEKPEKIDGSILGALAVFVGDTRLIDNFILHV
ncbi:MAG: pantoate--beta-alanine ligase [Oscillospiraceae bacterium]|nr:pantoate--beta-alanine ligase [Oscillospiraceae bacterium]